MNTCNEYTTCQVKSSQVKSSPSEISFDVYVLDLTFDLTHRPIRTPDYTSQESPGTAHVDMHLHLNTMAVCAVYSGFHISFHPIGIAVRNLHDRAR